VRRLRARGAADCPAADGRPVPAGRRGRDGLAERGVPRVPGAAAHQLVPGLRAAYCGRDRGGRGRGDGADARVAERSVAAGRRTGVVLGGAGDDADQPGLAGRRDCQGVRGTFGGLSTSSTCVGCGDSGREVLTFVVTMVVLLVLSGLVLL